MHRLRLWDTRTAWLNLEPAPGRWAWDQLDRHVANAEAHGVDEVTLVLAGTPRWAASRFADTDAPWMGPGSASPPADAAEWAAFVRETATRYAGRIQTYEIGNEPNLPTFWNGSPTEYQAWVQTAVAAIREADPTAKVIVAGGLVRRQSDIPGITPWLDAVAQVQGIDAVSVHFYPSSRQLDEAERLFVRTRSAIRAAVGELPAWVTEVNVTGGGFLSKGSQREAVTTLTQALKESGYSRVDWYAWTDLGPSDQIHLAAGTPAAEALADLV